MKNRFIDIHTHKIYHDGTTFIWSQAIGRDTPPPPGTLYSAGIHPWDAGKVDVERALDYLRSAPVMAIGEIGLDYASDIDREQQLSVFKAQLDIAAKRNLPIIIHCVRAYNDVVSLLKDYVLKAVVFHGYIGSVEQTQEILNRGFYLSFGSRSLKSPKTVESLRMTPLEMIFAETDENNDDISLAYNKIAELKEVSLEVLQDVIIKNFKRIFDE